MTPIRPSAALALLLAATLAAARQPPQPPPQPPKAPKPSVSVNDPKATAGYTLVAALNSTKVHLVDLDGRVAKTWDTGFTPGASTYLLENGHLLRTCNLGAKAKMSGAAQGGKVMEFDWDGNVVWDFTYTFDKSHPHHDVCKLPNGNVLMVVWDKKTPDEAVAAGRRPDTLRNELLADAILEVKPTGKTTGEIVWEWRAWDHLVQDFDKTKANHGNIAQRADRIDVNFGSGMLANMMANADDLKKLQDLGYVGAAPKDGGKGPGFSPDWMHTNAIAYNADLDQIVLSVHAFSEIWVIDHSTTTAEAAGRTGGKSGKGGDLLYRWGNPKAYRSGTNADQKLFSQHNAHWIPKGSPGAGNIIIFNNGGGRPGGNSSSVDEIAPPVGPDGKYARKAGLAFGPDKPVWSYAAEKKSDFYATFISGAHRLPNGHTAICSGPDGTVFEVTPEKQIVWKFQNPVARGGGGPGGPGGFPFPGGFPVPGQLMPGMMQEMLKFTADQKKSMEELQKEVDAKLEAVLDDDQKKQWKAMRAAPAMPFPGGGPPGGGGPGGPGGLFRAYRYPADYPAFKDKELKPGKKIEELDAKN